MRGENPKCSYSLTEVPLAPYVTITTGPISPRVFPIPSPDSALVLHGRRFIPTVENPSTVSVSPVEHLDERSGLTAVPFRSTSIDIRAVYTECFF